MLLNPLETYWSKGVTALSFNQTSLRKHSVVSLVCHWSVFNCFCSKMEQNRCCFVTIFSIFQPSRTDAENVSVHNAWWCFNSFSHFPPFPFVFDETSWCMKRAKFRNKETNYKHCNTEGKKYIKYQRNMSHVNKNMWKSYMCNSI